MVCFDLDEEDAPNDFAPHLHHALPPGRHHVHLPQPDQLHLHDAHLHCEPKPAQCLEWFSGQ